MTDPIHMRYVGTREGLAGRTALVRTTTQPGVVVAQFDDVGQRRCEELDGCRNVSELEQLMFGWHQFSADEFEAEEIGDLEEDD